MLIKVLGHPVRADLGEIRLPLYETAEALEEKHVHHH
jgi:hypothetical protein